MKQYVYILFLILCLLFVSKVNAQILISNSVGVADSTAILEIKSTSKGFLPPRMTAEQRDSITNPTAGLMVYCSDCLEMQMYNDTAWTNMIGLPAKNPPIPTIVLGTQTWMAYNLNLGTMINGNTNMADNSILEKYCYNNDAENCTIYGAQYQWDEMMQYTTTPGTQGICPTGFHLPTDDEWKTLEIHLGMTQAQADGVAYRGTNQGSQLASIDTLWNDGALIQNSAFGMSGFAALPGGARNTSGSFFSKSDAALYWSSSENGVEAYYRVIAKSSSKVSRNDIPKERGYQVRCIED